MIKALTTKTSTVENADGTVTTTTTTFNLDGTKSVKRKTAAKRVKGDLDGNSSHHGMKRVASSSSIKSTGGMKRVSSSGSVKSTGGMKRVSSNGSVKSVGSRGSIKMFPADERGRSTPKRSLSGKGSVTIADMVEEVKHELTKILGSGHNDDSAFAKKTSRAIPAQIVLIASQDDKTQSQEGDKAKPKYGLPNVPEQRGDWGSLATSAFLQLLHENAKAVVGTSNTPPNPLNCRQVVKEIQQRVKKTSSLQEANPILSSSRPLGPPTLKQQYAPFYIVPPGFTGKRRALLISVVTGEGHDLHGPPNDVSQVSYFLSKHCGFHKDDVVILREDAAARGKYKPSTRQNILDGFSQMVKLSQPKDVCFIQFSGHGGRLGNDLYINPCDYKDNGQIMDYEILRDLTKNLPSKVHATMLVDCCYSGCIGDLPYSLHAKPPDGDEAKENEQEFDCYFDTHTRQETMDLESDPEYQQRRQARNKWRNVNRIATAARAYAVEKVQEVSKTGSNHVRSSVKAAKQALDKGSDHVRSSLRSSTTSAAASSDEENKPQKINRRASTGGTEKDVNPKPRASTGTDPKPQRKASMAAPKKAISPIPRNSRSKTDLQQAAKEATKRVPPKRAKSSVARATPKTDAAPTRAPPRRAKSSVEPPKKSASKSLEELAREKELAEREAAVRRSKRESAKMRAALKAQ